MKLYGSLTSPYVRKVRIVLKEKEIPCEFVVADTGAPDSPVPALNPLGKVPVLQRDDGPALFDSPVIVEYLDALKGAPLIPAAGEARWETLRWHALGQGILDAVVTRLLEARRPPERQSPEAIARQEGKVAAALRYAETASRGTGYLVGGGLTLADIALGVALEYTDFRHPHDWRSRHPRLAQWLAAIGARPGWAETRPPGLEQTRAAAR